MKERVYRDRPEDRIVSAIRSLMHDKGWHTEKTHGGSFQEGFPDLYCLHPEHGPRWIEVKTLKGRLTPAQYNKFPIWEAHGAKIWILTSADEYPLLFKEPNWSRFKNKVSKRDVRKFV